MNRRPERMRMLALAVLVLILGGAAPALARAAWLGYRNDTNAVLVVQTASIVDRQVRLGKPQRLYPGEVAWESVSSGDKQLICTVYEASSLSRPIHQESIAFEGKDLFFSIQIEVPPPAKPGEKPQASRAKLVPAKSPARAPRYAAGPKR